MVDPMQKTIDAFNANIEKQTKLLERIAGRNPTEEFIFDGKTLQKIPVGLHLVDEILINSSATLVTSRDFQTFPFTFFTFYYAVENYTSGTNTIVIETLGADGRYYTVDTQSFTSTTTGISLVRGLFKTIRARLSVYGSGNVTVSLRAG